MHSTTRAFLLAAALFGSTSILPAQQPEVLNAQVSTQALHGNLQATLDQLRQSATPLWAAYTVPTSKPFHSGWNPQVAYLEKYDSSDNEPDNTQSSEADHAIILFRLASGKVDNLRAESVDRKLDAGGLRLVWLTGVTPEDSIATLKAFALEADSKHLINSSVFLISIHRSAATMPALIALTAPGGSIHLREQAVFWMASQPGHEGFVAIQHLLRTDKDDEFRAKLVFDLTRSKDTEALPELVRTAHDDASPRVRSQAQFWMASKGGKIVTASLQDAAENDADADNRKKAVFAISRLPNGDAATQLVQLAQTSKYPEVRKQAVFWLGQSKDPKALDYLTKLVTSPSH